MHYRNFSFNPKRDVRNIIWWWDADYRPSIVPNGTDGPLHTRRILRRAGVVDGVERPGVNFGMVQKFDPVAGRMTLDQHNATNSTMSNELSLPGLNLTQATLVHVATKPGNNDNGAFYNMMGGALVDTYHAYSGDNNCYDDFGSTVRQQFTHAADFTGKHIIVTRARNGRWEFWCDGVNQYTTNTNTFSLAGAAVRGAELPRSNVSSGSWCESFLIGRFITDDEMHAFNRYLSAKWKIPLRTNIKASGSILFGRRITPVTAAAAAYRARVVRWG